MHQSRQRQYPSGDAAASFSGRPMSSLPSSPSSPHTLSHSHHNHHHVSRPASRASPSSPQHQPPSSENTKFAAADDGQILKNLLALAARKNQAWYVQTVFADPGTRALAEKSLSSNDKDVLERMILQSSPSAYNQPNHHHHHVHFDDEDRSEDHHHNSHHHHSSPLSPSNTSPRKKRILRYCDIHESDDAGQHAHHRNHRFVASRGTRLRPSLIMDTPSPPPGMASPPPQPQSPPSFSSSSMFTRPQPVSAMLHTPSPEKLERGTSMMNLNGSSPAAQQSANSNLIYSKEDLLAMLARMREELYAQMLAEFSQTGTIPPPPPPAVAALPASQILAVEVVKELERKESVIIPVSPSASSSLLSVPSMTPTTSREWIPFVDEMTSLSKAVFSSEQALSKAERMMHVALANTSCPIQLPPSVNGFIKREKERKVQQIIKDRSKMSGNRYDGMEDDMYGQKHDERDEEDQDLNSPPKHRMEPLAQSDHDLVHHALTYASDNKAHATHVLELSQRIISQQQDLLQSFLSQIETLNEKLELEKRNNNYRPSPTELKLVQTDHSYLMDGDLVEQEFARNRAASLIQGSFRKMMQRKKEQQKEQKEQLITGKLDTKHKQLKECWELNWKRQKIRKLDWIHRIVSSIFKHKMLSDSVDDREVHDRASVPDFLFEYMKQTYGQPSIIDEMIVSVIASCQRFRARSPFLEAFLKFLLDKWPLAHCNLFLFALQQMHAALVLQAARTVGAVSVPNLLAETSKPCLIEWQVLEAVLESCFSAPPGCISSSGFQPDYVLASPPSLEGGSEAADVSSSLVPILNDPSVKQSADKQVVQCAQGICKRYHLRNNIAKPSVPLPPAKQKDSAKPSGKRDAEFGELLNSDDEDDSEEDDENESSSGSGSDDNDNSDDNSDESDNDSDSANDKKSKGVQGVASPTKGRGVAVGNGASKQVKFNVAASASNTVTGKGAKVAVSRPVAAPSAPSRVHVFKMPHWEFLYLLLEECTETGHVPDILPSARQAARDAGAARKATVLSKPRR